MQGEKAKVRGGGGQKNSHGIEENTTNEKNKSVAAQNKNHAQKFHPNFICGQSEPASCSQHLTPSEGVKTSNIIEVHESL